ncbi:MAG: 4-alpha-glucanotransferase [Candidatus Omnitrophica bacterium]|nr:4-alpha-glucanotransferase [Candidatus Omnitrophota bacterium]
MKTIMDEYQGLYDSFLSSRCAKQWARIGVRRRAGVATPLFSLYSSQSAGIGDLLDLKLLLDWCRKCGMTILQLLPMNDVGFDFRPYDSHSSFALEPVYLSFRGLSGVDGARHQKDVDALRAKFPAGRSRVDYGIKKEKMELLWKIFRDVRAALPASFAAYRARNRFWLKDYALFKVIKETHEQRAWDSWEEGLKHRDPARLKQFEAGNETRVLFYEWLQWQLHEQFVEVKRHAESRGVLLLGDLPLLVSRDSADVWSHQEYFKLDYSAGAPPDMYIARGQRWGMPPYDWGRIAGHGYDYLKEKLTYAQNFYDLFRIDHVVGIFRIWTIPLSEPSENGGLNGHFDPPDENVWEDHGRTLLNVMLDHTGMLPCAEDLGVVPPCSYKLLAEFAIPGMDVQRWTKSWEGDHGFKPPAGYRTNSVNVISTHDMSNLAGWWEFEAGTVDEEMFLRKCVTRGISSEAVKPALFDAAKSRHGKLRWKAEISSPAVLAGALGRREDEVRDFIDLYLGSYNEKSAYWRYLGLEGPVREQFSPELGRKALETANRTASIFSIQLLQDWLSMDPSFRFDPWTYRINFPGTMTDANWSLTLPFPLEKLSKLETTGLIKGLNQQTGRI